MSQVRILPGVLMFTNNRELEAGDLIYRWRDGKRAYVGVILRRVPAVTRQNSGELDVMVLCSLHPHERWAEEAGDEELYTDWDSGQYFEIIA